jgi:hypothetical protein
MRNNAFVKVQGLVLKRDFEGSAPMSKAIEAMNAACITAARPKARRAATGMPGSTAGFPSSCGRTGRS